MLKCQPGEEQNQMAMSMESARKFLDYLSLTEDLDLFEEMVDKEIIYQITRRAYPNQNMKSTQICGRIIFCLIRDSKKTENLLIKDIKRILDIYPEASLDYQDPENGVTPLMSAAAKGNYSILTMILDRHPNLDLTDHQDQTWRDYCLNQQIARFIQTYWESQHARPNDTQKTELLEQEQSRLNQLMDQIDF